MKIKNKSILRAAFAVFLSISIFSAFVYGYLYINMKSEENKADTKEQSIPYEYPNPDNIGLLFEINEKEQTLIYLDFEGDCIHLLDISKEDISPSDYGFPTDYKITANYDTVKTAIDIVGGIDLEIDGEALRYTGVQIVDILSTTVDVNALSRQIFLNFFTKVSKNGILREDLISIFKTTSSDISVPDYYRWADYLKDMSRRVSYVN